MIRWEDMFPPESQDKNEHRTHLFAPVFLILGVVMWAGWIAFHKPPPFISFVLSSFPREEVAPEPLRHLTTPEEVRGIYWTASTAHSSRGWQLLDDMLATGLNSVVIDIKMDNGDLAFPPKEIVRELGEQGIYRIARVAVMRDEAFAREHPELALKTSSGALWQDTIGSVWVDPVAHEVWDYAIELGREAYARGFDEVQFDYVRFPSDGSTGEIVYPVYDRTIEMETVMREFFQTVGGAMRALGIPVSFDVFGMTFWSSDDFDIGQRLADVYPNADFISPMVYPSHYPDGFRGYGNPALYPYEIVKRSLDEGATLLEREQGILPEASRTKFRPWIQGFDLGAIYTSEMIEEQIHAARDAGASGFLIWNARNVYEPANYLR